MYVGGGGGNLSWKKEKKKQNGDASLPCPVHKHQVLLC